MLAACSGEPAESAPPPGVSAGAPAAVPDALPEVPPALDLSAANRRAPVDGLPDWSHAGYREGAGLPGDDEITTDEDCVVTAGELAADYDVRPDDERDDSAGLQQVIDDVRDDCSPDADYESLSLVELPAGELAVSRQLAVDADYLVLRGAGGDPATGTRIVFRPDENTRYDSVSDGDWDEDGMTYESGKGGWLWPGRGLFRVQSRQVHEDYTEDHESAPANRRDLFEGTVNVHWKSGAELAGLAEDPGFAARTGDTVVPLAKRPKDFTEGGYVNIRAANTVAFYEQQQALPTDHDLRNLHMRQQIFRITEVDEDARTITLDRPLEFDVPVSSVSDGSEEIDGKVYESKAAPLVDPVLGVGIENLYLTQVVEGHTPAEAVHDYANLSPADQLHGIVFKWVVNGWVRGVTTYLTGSHPLVTEKAKNLQVEGNRFVGSWNKGKGGNGYLRGSRVWDSVYAGNVLRGLRHFTFQWSASGNVFTGNDTDADVNFHGGWERHNLVERNTVAVPYAHRPGNCTVNCGGEGGATEDDSAWYPVWWGAGRKAVKWSGATGPRNVLFNNTLSKQETEDGEFVPYLDAPGTVLRFGWNGTAYEHLSTGGTPIDDWAGHETTDFTDGGGVDASLTDDAPSLFLTNVTP
ncbi:hypothetical protein BLA60_07780 [Actinophytocola xinjiangensis]|uniref:Uncharacterized protein n=2 Tax=Actinophytocola xinjiangensis TaxID=485602 RepID=A0A7Z0WQR9_9PSEU|nr:hypothetical protein BLA60_07780 [Actinophytocola xinjiangensis]